ncbi:unnamed protein product [Lupinus luteus]|uniref:Uncharacterized protein n=1 Tax=Lupinus luteus TaxID=3873 RepID=A0AAV1Y376_LUPLU
MQKQPTNFVNNATTLTESKASTQNNAGFQFGPEQYAQLASLLQSVTQNSIEHNINQLSITQATSNNDHVQDQEDQAITGYDYLEDDWTC